MMKRLLAILFACAVAICLTGAPALAGHGGWRKVMSFNVLVQGTAHKADLGNHRIVVASWAADLGWDIGVYNYPRKKSQQNLLYQGRNLHGIQPWMAFAWAKHEKIFPDTRELTYNGEGKSHLRIVLAGCETRQVGKNAYAFVKGRIEVFHKP